MAYTLKLGNLCIRNLPPYPMQVGSGGHKMFLCFGAVEEDGYGVCYNPRETELLFTVTSWRHYQDTDSLRMVAQLHHSLTDMKDVLLSSGRAKAKL